MEEKIIKLLDLMTEIVEDDKFGTWTRKRDLIRLTMAKSNAHDVAFEEFIAWFE